jgi:predicted enzyme related to lactoylglutathione lyase
MGLSEFKVGAAIPVTDIGRAKEFYEGKLGLENGRDVEDGGVTYASKGVRFEHYDSGPIKTNEKGIAEPGGAKIAWFKDPDGNVLGLVGQ